MKAEQFDPFISTEEDVEVDDHTAAAIRQGIEDAGAGRGVTPGRGARAHGPVAFKVIISDVAL